MQCPVPFTNEADWNATLDVVALEATQQAADVVASLSRLQQLMEHLEFSLTLQHFECHADWLIVII